MAAQRDDDGTLSRVHSIEFAGHQSLEGVVGFNLAVDRRLPRIVLDFAEIEGRMVCVNIEIGASFDNPAEPEPEPITTDVLRRIPLARLIEETLWQAVRTYTVASNWEGAGEIARKRLPAAELATQRPKRPGRPPLYDDKHFKEVARIYREHSGGHAPTKAVATHFNTTKSNAAKWVSEARRRDFLEPPSSFLSGRPAAGIRQSRKRRQTRRAT